MFKEIALGLVALTAPISPKGANASTPPTSVVNPEYFAEVQVFIPDDLPTDRSTFGFVQFDFIRDGGSTDNPSWVAMNNSQTWYTTTGVPPSSAPNYFKHASWVSLSAGPYQTYTNGIVSSYLFGAPYQSNDYNHFTAWNTADTISTFEVRVYFIYTPVQGEYKTITYWPALSTDTFAHKGTNDLYLMSFPDSTIGLDYATSTSKSLLTGSNGLVPDFNLNGVSTPEEANNIDTINTANTGINLGAVNEPSYPFVLGNGFNPLTQVCNNTALRSFYNTSNYLQNGWLPSGMVKQTLFTLNARGMNFKFRVGYVDYGSTGVSTTGVGYQQGFDDGKQAGYSEGFNAGLNSGGDNGVFNLITNGLNSVSSIASIKIFPGITLGGLIALPIAGALLYWLLKLLRG